MKSITTIISFLIVSFITLSFVNVYSIDIKLLKKQDTTTEDKLCKKWRLVQKINPVIGSDDFPLGQDSINYNIDSIANEILLINKNNTYTQYWRNETNNKINEKKGKWEVSSNPEGKYVIIFFKDPIYTWDNIHNISHWYIHEITNSKLILRYQTRGGCIYYKYIPAQ